MESILDIELTYKDDENQIIKILNGENQEDTVNASIINFVNANKNKCVLIIDSKEYPLLEYFKFATLGEHTVILRIKQKLNDIRGIFFGCSKLTSIKNIENLDISDIVSFEYMFYGCTSLKFIGDISKWDTSNIVDMVCMFMNCENLTELPNIEIWNTSRVVYMDDMFYGCLRLKTPDISRWNMKKLKSKFDMFEKCGCLVGKENGDNKYDNNDNDGKIEITTKNLKDNIIQY